MVFSRRMDIAKSVSSEKSHCAVSISIATRYMLLIGH